MTYDEWKTTDPRDLERNFRRCPFCKARHYEDETCQDGQEAERDGQEADREGADDSE